MNVRRELLWSLAVLTAINLALAFAAIGLLSRMGPAVDRILRDNVDSIVATEEMLSALALAPDGIGADAGSRIEAALQRATDNVTEPEEPPIIDRARDALAKAVRGQPGARTDLVDAIVELSSVNRRAMRRHDEEAQQLSTAGSWAAAIAGLLSLWASVFVVARLRKRLLAPMLDLVSVLRAHHNGDSFRRCGAPEASDEWAFVFIEVDRLLDESSKRRGAQLEVRRAEP